MSFDDGFDWGKSPKRGNRPSRGRANHDHYGQRDISTLPISPAEALEPSLAPERISKKRTMHPMLAFLNRAITLSVLALVLVGGLLFLVKDQFDRPGPLDHSTVVVIPRGEGVNGIAQRLEDQKIISDRRLFVASVMYFGAQKKLKAGEYEIRKKASMRQVLERITQGKSILHKVTIPEGLTSLQILARIEEHPMLKGALSQIPDEGTLLPDTYKFTRGMTRAEIVERMQAEQKKFLDRLWEKRAPDLPFSTKQEALTLASIVEKETGRADERRRVAGVFVNRLKRGMRLQSDPTIIYGIIGGKGKLGRPIKRSEINKKTPYNTYQIDGLPPGPIANPGRAAIEAVLNPAPTKDVFFVADGTGGHVFAETLKEHNRNVANWRKIEKEMRARQEQAQKDSAALKQSLGTEPVSQASVDLKTLPGVSVAPPATAGETTASAAEPSQVGREIPIPVRKPNLR